MPYTHCQIFIDDAGTTLFTFPAGTVSAKVKCVGRGGAGNGQTGGGGGGYAETAIPSPSLVADEYNVGFDAESSSFNDSGGTVAKAAHGWGVGQGGGTDISNVGDLTNLGGNGGAWVSGTGGCGGGGCGGPDGAGQNGGLNYTQYEIEFGGRRGAPNAGTQHDLTEGVGETRIDLLSFSDNGDGGNPGQNGKPGNSPGGGGGGQGDSPPNGPGAGADGVVVILYTVASFVPKVIII